MSKINFQVLIYFVVMFFGCNKGIDLEDSGIPNEIKISKNFLSRELSDFQFETIDTIDLEIPGNPSLTYFQDIAFANDFFFVLDIKQGLIKFDYDGNYLKTIGVKGQGPDEYYLATSLYLDNKSKIIYMTDWGNMSVLSYDFEGNFIGTIKSLGQPILLFNQNDSLYVIQEYAYSSEQKNRMDLIVSRIDPGKFSRLQQKNLLYSYVSDMHTIYHFPWIFGGFNGKNLFYLPRPRFEGLIEHKDTIYREVNKNLIPEYLLNFTDFDKNDTLRISHLEMFDSYASLLFSYKRKGYMIMLDLERNIPFYYLQNPINNTQSELNIDNFPKHLDEYVFYSVVRNIESEEEKNPMIVFYRFNI
ncbi:6-bladed beta-propeller [Algoriphagus pacificus]|uniref:6-bladed beta-propeller n=1 Tax=Algoriphagus pacificus TaxID=2811234 RepID=A0ABS3CLQ6_9BACT|nr:6-bladed beta-propeller [Algoriphagus pacificus]MBN7818031.1 6-bladed beta-propeller [Algoriphagus pacificus]